MNILVTHITSVLQFGLLHLLDAINISEPGMLVLLGSLLLGIGSVGKRKLPQ